MQIIKENGQYVATVALPSQIIRTSEPKRRRIMAALRELGSCGVKFTLSIEELRNVQELKRRG